jgi:hypothetical protein
MIILVGGFGRNRFLLEQIRQAFPDISLQRPKNAWTAVYCGAVMKGIQDCQSVPRVASGKKVKSETARYRHTVNGWDTESSQTTGYLYKFDEKRRDDGRCSDYRFSSAP